MPGDKPATAASTKPDEIQIRKKDDGEVPATKTSSRLPDDDDDDDDLLPVARNRPGSATRPGSASTGSRRFESLPRVRERTEI